jgi:DnaJ domain
MRPRPRPRSVSKLAPRSRRSSGAYREAVKQAHPDLHPEDVTAAERFRSVQEAYESLTGQGGVTGNGGGAGVNRFHIPSAATVSSLDIVETDWLVGSGDGTLFRLSNQGRLVARVRIATGAVFPVRDSSQAVVAFCTSPVAFCSQPNLWFVDAHAPFDSPTSTHGPTSSSAATAPTCSPTDLAAATSA